MRTQSQLSATTSRLRLARFVGNNPPSAHAISGRTLSLPNSIHSSMSLIIARLRIPLSTQPSGSSKRQRQLLSGQTTARKSEVRSEVPQFLRRGVRPNSCRTCVPWTRLFLSRRQGRRVHSFRPARRCAAFRCRAYQEDSRKHPFNLQNAGRTASKHHLFRVGERPFLRAKNFFRPRLDKPAKILL